MWVSMTGSYGTPHAAMYERVHQFARRMFPGKCNDEQQNGFCVAATGTDGTKRLVFVKLEEKKISMRVPTSLLDDRSLTSYHPLYNFWRVEGQNYRVYRDENSGYITLSFRSEAQESLLLYLLGRVIPAI